MDELKSQRRKQKHDYNPCIGVKSDFETLLQRFSSFGTVRYEKFAECWKELCMSCYCAGRLSQREAREYVEDCFLIATQYWLPPSSFLIRAGALYLLYGLYYYQLVIPKVKIRISHQNWSKILEFQQEAKEQQHHDLDYIFHKMLSEKCFVFVATDDDMYPTMKGFVDTKMIPESMKDETGLLDEVFSNSSVNQLSLVHDQYQKMKISLNTSDTGQPDTSLNIAHSDLIDSINKTLTTHKQRQKNLANRIAWNPNLPIDTENIEPTSKPDDSVSMKKHLKLKAFEYGASTESDKKTENEKEEAEYSWHVDTGSKSTLRKPKWIKKRDAAALFDRDENEDTFTLAEAPDVKKLMCMPDVSDGTENSAAETDATSQESESDTPSESQKKMEKRKADVQSEKSVHTNHSASKRLKTDNDGKDESDNGSDVEIVSEKDSITQKTKSTPKSKAKGVSKKTEMKEELASASSRKFRRNVKTNTDPVTLLTDSESESNKGNKLTAQEQLQLKLTQKRKEARLKSIQNSSGGRHIKKSKGKKKK